MNVKRTLLALSTVTTLALAAGTASADTTIGAGSYNISATSASVSQTITVTVPKRFGLHLHRSSWTLDLNNVQENGTGGVEGSADIKCVRAGDHSSGVNGTGRDFLYYLGTPAPTTKDAKILSLINGATYEGDQVADTTGNAYSYTGNLTWPTPSNPGVGGTAIASPIGGYPGFYVSGGKLVWKGPIMCSFQTIVQKFSNSSTGFDFTAKLAQGTSSTFPLPLYVRDFIKGPAITGVSTSSVALRTSDSSSSRLALGQGVTSGGWLDDHLLQVLVFDGSETNGSYVGNVTYTLTDTTVPSSL